MKTGRLKRYVCLHGDDVKTAYRVSWQISSSLTPVRRKTGGSHEQLMEGVSMACATVESLQTELILFLLNIHHVKIERV